MKWVEILYKAQQIFQNECFVQQWPSMKWKKCQGVKCSFKKKWGKMKIRQRSAHTLTHIQTCSHSHMLTEWKCKHKQCLCFNFAVYYTCKIYGTTQHPNVCLINKIYKGKHPESPNGWYIDSINLISLKALQSHTRTKGCLTVK